MEILESGKGFHAAFMSWWADYDDHDNFLYSLGYSGIATNYSHYSNPKFDRLIDKAREVADPSAAERVELYGKAESMLLDDVAIVPLYHLNERTLYQPYVKGIVVSEFGFSYSSLEDVWLEKTGARTTAD